MRTDTFIHVPALIEEVLSAPESTNSQSNLTSDTNLDKQFFREETAVMITIYRKSERTQLLKHWIRCEYLDDGAIFICRIIRHGLEKAQTHPEKIEILLEIESYLRFTVIGSLKSVGGATPNCPTPDVMDLSVSDIAQAAVSQARIPGYDLLLLKRDGFMCQVSKMYSFNGIKKLDKLGKKEEAAELDAKSEAQGTLTKTEAVHIIPFRLGKFTGGNEQEKMLSWQGLYHVFPEIRRLIDTTSINAFHNALTLAAILHYAFGEFSFGLCPMGENRYHLITFDNLATREPLKGIFKGIPVNSQGYRIIEFSYAPDTLDNAKVSDTLLRVHLAICQIYHLIGGADVWDDLSSDDEEEVPAPAYDGTCLQFAPTLTRKLLSLV